MDDKPCPEIPAFGAQYPDGRCIDGFMWDLDSCDVPGGPLFHGGDMPCPFCNAEAAVKYVAEDIWSSSETMSEREALLQAAEAVNATRAVHGFGRYQKEQNNG